MQLYKLEDKDYSLTGLDIFQLVEMEDADEATKLQFLEEIAVLINQYFLQEKLGQSLTKQRMEEIVEKYPLDTEEEMQEFLIEIGDEIPNVSELFMDALLETKATIITEHYENKRDSLASVLNSSTNPELTKLTEEQIERCTRKLKLIHNRNWELLIGE